MSEHAGDTDAVIPTYEDSAAAQLLLVRKRAELEDLMKLVKRN